MNKCFFGDCREVMRQLISDSIKVQTCVTSPPYFGLRDYGHPGQLGLEKTPDEYVAQMIDVFRLVRELLTDDGTLWLNLGDSYSSGGRKTRDPGQSKLHPAFTGEDNAVTTFRPDDGMKPKDLLGIPWRVAFALQTDGWWLRQDIIWHKPNPMPESVTDRCTKAHEYLFMFSKSERYYYDQEAIKEPATRAEWMYETPTTPGNKDRKDGGCTQRKTDKQRGHSRRHAGFNDRWDQMTKEEQCSGMRNKRSVWTIPTVPYDGAHFATFPPALIEPCILAGSRSGDIVLDPFFGSGTTGQVSQNLGRQWIGIELNQDYEVLQQKRTAQTGMCL